MAFCANVKTKTKFLQQLGKRTQVDQYIYDWNEIFQFFYLNFVCVCDKNLQ